MNRLVDGQRILSKAECEAIARRVKGFARDGDTRLEVASWWNGELRWARNRVSLAGDRRDHSVTVVCGFHGHATTNQLDDVSLESVVRAAERSASLAGLGDPRRPIPLQTPRPVLAVPTTVIWSDATYGLTTEKRGEVARRIVEMVEAAGMLSAGYLEVRGGSVVQTLEREPLYSAFTQAQCSLTVRDPRGTGSGWAGLSSYDWSKLDPYALAERALQKCLASRSPVALEPGRYTVILEPQAVADLLQILIRAFWRLDAENGKGPFALALDQTLNLWRTKLGLPVVDERITISHNPADPDQGIIPTPGMRPVKWIDRGVLTNLWYMSDYAAHTLNEHTGVRGPHTGYRMSGGESSVEEMIGATRRGLLVTRFSNIEMLDPQSLVSTGLTRDGLWLIENGKITKAVKNFRFTESPLFMLNSIEQLGVPVPVFSPVRDPTKPGLTPVIVPAIKARDFSFTSTIDAI